MKFSFLIEKRARLVISLLFILLIFNIFLIRMLSNSPLLVGDEPYYNLRIVNSFLDKGFIEEDKLVYGWRPYSINSYHLILILTAIVFGAMNASIFLPLIIGFASLICLYLILTKIKIDTGPKLVFMLFYILSPLFLYTLFIGHSEGAAVLLQLFGFLLYLQQTKRSILAAIGIFSIASLFGPSHMLFTLVVLGIYSFYNREKLPHFYLLLFIFSLIALLIYVPTIQKEGFPLLKLASPYLVNFITDFGAKQGISLFMLALSLLGFLRVWNRKKETPFLLIFLLVSTTVFLGINKVYTNLALAFFAGLGFIYISKTSWSLKKLKSISLILILVGLFFSTNSYAIRLAESSPDYDLLQSMEWLKLNSAKNDFIFSDVENSLWIETFAERPVLLDRFIVARLFEERENVLQTLIESYDLRKTSQILGEYDIKYILETPGMFKTYDKSKKGLFYLLKNNETFKKVYDTNNIRIYKVEIQENLD